MMDPSNLSTADGLEAGNQNGVHEEPSNSEKDGVVSDDVDPIFTEITETVSPNGTFENFNQSDSTATDNSSVAEIKEGLNDKIDGDNVTISKEEEVRIIDQPQQLRAHKGTVKIKNAMPPGPRGVHASGGKRSKDGKDEEASSAVSNGSLALESHSRQPIENRSFNDRKTQLSKHPRKSAVASSEVPVGETKLRSLKKGPLDNVQGEVESSLSITVEDAKPRRAGTLPNYGFSFKCDERAERRREFYSKLEEKIHAKEVEKSNLQAKSKETQEAEIKMLRKSLAFKATPMPSFYQEPPPARLELKKIPTTRAKSPKLGRRKGSTNSESEGNTSSNAPQGRSSLDEKVSRSHPTKGITPVHQKKPQRRSLPPQLASERISSSNSITISTSSKAVNDEKASSSATNKGNTLPNATVEEKIEMTAASEVTSTFSSETSEALPLSMPPSNKQNQTESHVNDDIVIEEKPQLALVQEPITPEH